jgi:threonine aldolase
MSAYDATADSATAPRAGRIIDLRSDTVTRPTPGMRAAMAQADVGDDVYGDDPTVNRLQDRFAELVGKEAALFVTSGTMGNQVCIAAHTRPGDEVIADAGSHIIHYEAAAPAALSGVAVHTLAGKGGVFTAEQVAAAVRPDNVHYPVSRLLLIENTHNRGGGTVWPLARIAEATAAARSRGLKCHMDGARLFNAVAATGIPPAEWARHFDSLTCCFSKGLGCPVGSIVAGSREFIALARRYRKMFGGALRQVGILAAAALYALDHHVGRLGQDHANARLLADGLSRIEDFAVEPEVPTNMVFWGLRNPAVTPESVVERARRRGVLFNHMGGGRFRAVTHLDVTAADVRAAAEILAEEMSGVTAGV